jgi:sugar phosphate isomerase/epimerase
MFGISTHCLHHKSLETALDCLAPITEIVEVMDDGFHWLESPDLLDAYSFQYFLHAPARSVNIASQLEPIRKASVEVIGESFAIAGEVDADVVIHPGYYTWTLDRENAARKLQKSLEELKALAEYHSITFYIENMPEWEHFFLKTPDELSLFDGIGLCLDIGHAHLNGCLPEFLACPVSHFHLHDNNGKEDSHDTIGEGEIDFVPVMEAVRRSGITPIIEVGSFKGVLRSIDYLNNL